MSEYQYYEFLAVDRPLTAQQLDELRRLSTRARITSTSFVNTYHWGNFRGDPRRLVANYFDAFLYLANWGTRQLMIRLPHGSLDLRTAQRYCDTESASAWAVGDRVIIDLTDQDEEGEWNWDDDGEGRLASIIPARADLAGGDLRLLYLAWLLAAGRYEIDDDEPEPPVPPGLGTLTAPLQSLVEFLRIDTDLLAVAAETSAPLSHSEPSTAELHRWLRGLPTDEKDELLLRILRDGDVPVRAELRRRLRAAKPDGDPTGAAAGGRTAGQLRKAAGARWTERQRQAHQRRAEESARQERAAAAARERRLTELAAQPEQAWQQVDTLIATKKPREYDSTVGLLTELAALGQRDGREEAFAERIRLLRQTHQRKPSLMDRFDRAGLPGG
ncbi:hypothetical protein ABZ807_21620 [Micromonospora sp. NPDC047548]|uniref:hypothetical protein n=1 Tax=Micromonospora sp. NPDC047548 TaxID=3155624 RepID=UPI0033FEE7FD